MKASQTQILSASVNTGCVSYSLPKGTRASVLTQGLHVESLPGTGFVFDGGWSWAHPLRSTEMSKTAVCNTG